MKQNYSHISILLDRSGSMASCEDVTREGFNAFLLKQREVGGDCSVSLVQFDDKYELNYSFQSVHLVPWLTKKNFVPRGMTAMHDAIAKCIDDTGKALAAMPESERPSRVIFVIQTDGGENSSREFSCEDVRQRITRQQADYNWDFVFLGANQDAVLVGTSLGVMAKSSMTYSTNHSTGMFNAAANYVTRYRCAISTDDAKLCSFSEEDRSAVVDETSNDFHNQ